MIRLESAGYSRPFAFPFPFGEAGPHPYQLSPISSERKTTASDPYDG